MARYLYLWLTDWPLTRWLVSNQQASAQAPPQVPPCALTDDICLVEKTPHGVNIVSASPSAREKGVRHGQKLTDARACVPHLTAIPHDAAKDKDALHRLAHWMMGWSPIISIHLPDSIILDTEGCDHLHGGEIAMLAAIKAQLDRRHLPHRLALASTVGAAAAFACTPSAPDMTIIPPGEEESAIAHLPINALRLTDVAHHGLRQFGLTQIQSLYPLSRSALARRFRDKGDANKVILRLDQALGRRAEPLDPICPPAQYSVRLPCPSPLLDQQGIEEGLLRLLPALEQKLAQGGVGARTIVLTAFHTDGRVSTSLVRTAQPEACPHQLKRLFGERIDQLDPGFGIDVLTLDGLSTSPLATTTPPLNAQLADGTQDLTRQLGKLADRIHARLGDGHVFCTRTTNTHTPEDAASLSPFTGDMISPSSINSGKTGPRPLRIFRYPEEIKALAALPDAPPKRFVWRRVHRHVVKADGPERITPPWWGRPPTFRRPRDYYRLEDQEGRRYWVYREGLYERNDAQPPRWYIQGLFA